MQQRNTYKHTLRWHTVFAWKKTKQSHTKSRQYNLRSISCGINEQAGPQNKQHCTTHGNAPKDSGFYPKLTYSTHVHNILVHAHKPLQIIKALTVTGWGKQKETLMATYKAVMRPALEYASSIRLPLASSTSINKLQVMQITTLITATGCTQDANIQHIHDETLTIQKNTKTQHTSHPLN